MCGHTWKGFMCITEHSATRKRQPIQSTDHLRSCPDRLTEGETSVSARAPRPEHPLKTIWARAWKSARGENRMNMTHAHKIIVKVGNVLSFQLMRIHKWKIESREVWLMLHVHKNKRICWRTIYPCSWQIQVWEYILCKNIINEYIVYSLEERLIMKETTVR